MLPRGLYGLRCLLQLQPSSPIPAVTKQKAERGTALPSKDDFPSKDASQEKTVASVYVSGTRNCLHGLILRRKVENVTCIVNFMHSAGLWKPFRSRGSGHCPHTVAPPLWEHFCPGKGHLSPHHHLVTVHGSAGVSVMGLYEFLMPAVPT